MRMKKDAAAALLAELSLGSSVAETDSLLEAARIETSVFDDLIADRVDLVPGTKGSGKTALYRIFVDFLPDVMLQRKRVVVAHGIRDRQDSVFLAHKERFDRLSEDDFLDFWSIYLISLAYEQFIKNEKYDPLLVGCSAEVVTFRAAYQAARIPDLDRRKTLREVIEWTLGIVSRLKPKVAWTPPGEAGQFELSFGGESKGERDSPAPNSPVMPQHLERLGEALEGLLSKCGLSLWLMLDRLDELFARRSETEKRALRGLLRTLRLFRSDLIRVKVFLRDDILEHLVSGQGFTALTHVTARKADTLRWSEEQILAMLIKRVFANTVFRDVFMVNLEILNSDIEYQRKMFYRIFDDTVHRGRRQSPTLRWIYTHTRDGRGVVTPRDVIDLVSRASQRQRDTHRADPNSETSRLIGGPAIIYGLEELSKEKRINYLQAEFPHLWPEINKLAGGGTEYSLKAIRSMFESDADKTVDRLISIGVLSRSTRKGQDTLWLPYLYRKGLECTQRYVP